VINTRKSFTEDQPRGERKRKEDTKTQTEGWHDNARRGKGKKNSALLKETDSHPREKTRTPKAKHSRIDVNLAPSSEGVEAPLRTERTHIRRATSRG